MGYIHAISLEYTPPCSQLSTVVEACTYTVTASEAVVRRECTNRVIYRAIHRVIYREIYRVIYRYL